MNIIGDVAGQYKTLLALVAKMPKGSVLLLGDIVDRGPRSKQVVEWCRKTPDVQVLKGNHEHMMVDFVLNGCKEYERDTWMINGGWATIKSYLPNVRSEFISPGLVRGALKDDAEWMARLPTWHQEAGLLCTHAPESNCPEQFQRLWNRSPARPMDGIFQVHGHNARQAAKWYAPLDPSGLGLKPFGINLDSSAGEVLTGMHWPSKELYTQEYIG